MNAEQIMPLVVLWIVWVVAVFNLRSHFLNRRMTAQHPKTDDNLSKLGSYETTPDDHPFSYWALLVFYLLAALLVPIITLYLLLSSSGN